ncbi:MAG: FAD-dependent monooxygenase, partial [Acetobacteraceae bacterium]|nr:FAD-dependent monooxygenase [Acetobacteraceae bacterium]
SHERPHGNVALEHFLPSGPFAQLPMAASTDALVGGVPHVSAIVWTERTPIAKRALQFDDARFAKEIARRLGGYLGELRVVGRRWSYPLSAMLVHRFAAARLALVGDAAHAIHPVAGQGLNLGFRDAIALADLIVEQAASGADPGSEALLLRYERRRRADILLMLGVTDGLNRLFSTDWPPLRLVRDLGMAAVDRTTPLKRVFIRQAMGIQPSCRAELSRLSG